MTTYTNAKAALEKAGEAYRSIPNQLKRTRFELAAKRMEREHGKPRPSWDHTVETYTGNTGIDWFYYGAMTVYMLFFISLLVALVHG